MAARLVAILALLVALPASALAQPWLVSGEGSVAVPVGSPQSGLFGTGASGAIGLYRPLGRVVAPGLRLRGTFLSDIGAPDDPGRADPGAGGIAALSLALRVRPAPGDGPAFGTGPFLEVAGGPALTGSLVRPSFEAAVGWGIAVGAVDLAPTLRYQQIVELDDQLESSDARVVMLGLEITLFDARPAPPAEEPPAPVRPAPEPAPVTRVETELAPIPEPRSDRDGDGFFDDQDECPDAREVVNGIDDLDGCPDEGLIELVDDRIVIEEHVLFAFDRAYVRPRARPIIEAILTLWRQHPEWAELRVEGHTDTRGAARYNMVLSQRRAESVMGALVEGGMPGDMIEAVGYGETRPLNLGTREATHRRNRRVELVVLSRREVPAGEEAPAGHVLDLVPGRDR